MTLFFKEKSFMKKYIEKNTKLRQKSLSKIKKDIYKLKNNSVYGKTMENARKYKNSVLTSIQLVYLKTFHFQHLKILRNFPGYSLGLSHHIKTECIMDKPIFIGSTVLDLSKKVMYESFYDYVKPKWGSKAKLLFTDTDSFRFQTETEDVYKDIAPDVDEWFDTSNFPKDHPSGVKVGINKMVPGKIKDELGGKQVQEFCGLKRRHIHSRMVKERQRELTELQRRGT